MKILLTAINAKYIHSNPAVYSLAAYANGNMAIEEKEKCKIEIAEYTINHRTESIIADIYKKKPDVLNFSCYIWNWEYVQEIMTELHKLMPSVPIYLGGPEVSFTSKRLQRQGQGKSRWGPLSLSPSLSVNYINNGFLSIYKYKLTPGCIFLRSLYSQRTDEM